MAIITIGEVLDRIRDFEIRLEAFYAQIRDNATNDGVRLLTYYLARHRRHQDQALKEADAQTLRHVRMVELKFDVLSDASVKLRIPDISPAKATGDELIEAAIYYDTELVRIYRAILSQPLGDDVRAILEALIHVEERDIIMLKKMLAMHYF